MNKNTRQLLQTERVTVSQQLADINMAALEQALSEATAIHERVRADYLDLQHSIANHPLRAGLTRLLQDEKQRIDTVASQVAKARGGLESARTTERDLREKLALLDEFLGLVPAEEAA